MTYFTRQVRLMGTIIDITLDATDDEGEAILTETFELLKLYEHRFSANDVTSELMAVNLQAGLEPVEVAPELFELIALGKQHSLPVDSQLDIAIGPLVQLWRIGFSDATVPTPEKIVAACALIDPQKIILDQARHSVYLTEAGMLLDLGALAKGFIGDLILAALKKRGVTNCLLNLGGNVLVSGLSPTQKKWRIGIRDPQKGQESSLAILQVTDQSIVTSGIYERTLTNDGKTYHHIIDAHTGYPMQTELASLTIISKKSVDGEIWTTRLFGKPTDEIIATVEAMPGLEALVITQGNDIFYTSGVTVLLT